jgi:serine/threonine protein kinase
MQCPRCAAPFPEESAYCPACGAAAPTVMGVEGTPEPRRPEKTQRSRVEGAHLVGGRYELLTPLGQGATGVVYRARDVQLGEEVALKLIHSLLLERDKEVERLKREIITARRITHPNVVRIHDFGIRGLEGFVTMELLEGGSLGDRLGSGEAMDYEEAAWTSLWIAEGLSAVHDGGIVHRDIKPRNVLFDLGGRPKLADFGLARLTSNVGSTIGMTGTPLYMSPEMASGGAISASCDVYSLGVMLFQMFAGRPPFESQNTLALIDMHLHDAPPRLSTFRPDVSPRVDALLAEMLEKDPEQRPTSGEVGDKLRDELDVPLGTTATRTRKGGRSGPKVILPLSPDEPSRTMVNPPRATRPAARLSKRTPNLLVMALIGGATAGALLAVSRWLLGY